MMGLITDTMQKALIAVAKGAAQDFTFHWGEAGGIAAADGLFGIKALELCDDISDAYEDGDVDFMHDLRHAVLARPYLGDLGDKGDVRTRQDALFCLEWGTALHEAIQAKEEDNLVRHSLMIGVCRRSVVQHASG